MGILKTIKKGVKSALGIDDPKKPKPVAPEPQMGPAGSFVEAMDRPAVRRRRGARGRDSTIITARSDIGSRTLLG